jgi:hypothetical protein
MFSKSLIAVASFLLASLSGSVIAKPLSSSASSTAGPGQSVTSDAGPGQDVVNGNVAPSSGIPSSGNATFDAEVQHYYDIITGKDAGSGGAPPASAQGSAPVAAPVQAPAPAPVQAPAPAPVQTPAPAPSQAPPAQSPGSSFASSTAGPGQSVTSNAGPGQSVVNGQSQ